MTLQYITGMRNHWLYYIRYAGAFFAIGGSVLLLAVAIKASFSKLQYVSNVQPKCCCQGKLLAIDKFKEEKVFFDYGCEGLHGLPD